MKRRHKLIVAILAAALLAAAVVVAVFLVHRSRRPAPPTAAASVPMELPAEAPVASLWVDVHAPAELWQAVRRNGWLSRALADPLGQGFAVGWAGFLGTRGEDMAGAFQGKVADLVLSGLLADPFRVVYYSGASATGAPAVLVPRPSSAARGAFEVLERVARNGGAVAERCPGPATDGASADPIAISRWLLADHPVFAGERDGRIALAKNPLAVLQGLCFAPPEAPALQGVHLSLGISPDGLGREAQLGAALLGLGASTRATFAVEGDRLVPRGLAGDLGKPGRLESASPGDPLLRLLPADAGVVVIASIRLPDALTRQALSEHLRDGTRGPTSARTVALVWKPHGDGSLPTEVALAWPERDAAALGDAFSGPNRMERRRACGHEILASTGALASAMARACERKGPSILDGAPPVVEGLRAPSSLGIGVNLGLVLSRLLGDAWTAEAGPGKRPSPEVESARRLLEELPFMGLRGVAKDGALVPGGYRS
ncbi:MAG TPA: hypothetical protein VLS93_18595 [Anaeromyxobacteraceae bacterium]|nr:hypothetical protein [Anaeromyxobacteraceae bacterium]